MSAQIATRAYDDVGVRCWRVPDSTSETSVPAHSAVPAVTATLIVTPDRDRRGRHDYTGAFQLDAIEIEKRYGGHVLRIDQTATPVSQLDTLLRAIDEHVPETLVYCGHGLAHSLPSLHLEEDDLPIVARTLRRATTAPRLVFYACSAGSLTEAGNPPCFAARFADALLEAGCVSLQIDAHSRAGHSSKNPHVRRFTAAISSGQYLVAPGTPYWRQWCHWLEGAGRYLYPWMTRDEIYHRLEEHAKWTT